MFMKLMAGSILLFTLTANANVHFNLKRTADAMSVAATLAELGPQFYDSENEISCQIYSSMGLLQVMNYSCDLNLKDRALSSLSINDLPGQLYNALKTDHEHGNNRVTMLDREFGYQISDFHLKISCHKYPMYVTTTSGCFLKDKYACQFERP